VTDLFHDVEEELRRDRYQRWLRKYGPFALGLLAAALVAVGGWQFYRGWQKDRAQEFSTEFVAAQKLMEEGKAPEAAAAFQGLAAKGPPIYREMSQMGRAAALTEQGELQAALAAFDAAAEQARDPIVKATAQLRAAYIVADTQDFQAVQARVAPIIEKGGPISYLARELLGVEAWEAGQFDLARETFENLRLAFEAPDSVRQRAQMALTVLGPGARSENSTPQSQETPRASGGETK
jgi:hypothetical protein